MMAECDRMGGDAMKGMESYRVELISEWSDDSRKRKEIGDTNKNEDSYM